jgi:hypothetical protein
MEQPGTWLTINEAAKLTGWLPDKIRSDRRRGRLQSRKNNAGEWLVLVPPEALMASSDAHSHANGHADGQAQGQAEAMSPAWLLEELAELRERLGHAEGRAAGMAEHIASIAASLAKTEARADQLQAALAEARKGWLERLLEAVRRR